MLIIKIELEHIKWIKGRILKLNFFLLKSVCRLWIFLKSKNYSLGKFLGDCSSFYSKCHILFKLNFDFY